MALPLLASSTKPNDPKQLNVYEPIKLVLDPENSR